MNTKQIIALAKEKLGNDITEQEAQDYLDGKVSLPDEALDLISSGLCFMGESEGTESLPHTSSKLEELPGTMYC